MWHFLKCYTLEELQDKIGSKKSIIQLSALITCLLTSNEQNADFKKISHKGSLVHFCTTLRNLHFVHLSLSISSYPPIPSALFFHLLTEHPFLLLLVVGAPSGQDNHIAHNLYFKFLHQKAIYESCIKPRSRES